MAEPAGCDPTPSSSDSKVAIEVKDDSPIPEKRRKLSPDKEIVDKLEYRLGGILCCAVCLDLPRAAVYQCTNGHLMCAPCFTHLLADGRLRDENSTCPNCRIEISKSVASRNLAVEKAISELPALCKFCVKSFPRHALQHHEEERCEDRIMGCRYEAIGCGWRGPAHEVSAHEVDCVHPTKSAAEVLTVVAKKDSQVKESNRVFAQLLDLLSYEKITFNDLQLKPYRTDEFVHKLYYETSRFSAFNHQWVVKMFVNKNQRDPSQSYERELSYQLVLKSKAASALGVQFAALRGPFGEAELAPRVVAHCFGEDAPDAPPAPLPLLSRADPNRLLAIKAIHFRLIMFLAVK